MSPQLAFLIFTAVTAAPLAAQQGFEFTPLVSAYVPTGNMLDVSGGTPCCHEIISQRPGLLYGAHLGFGALNRATLEATLDLGTSRVRLQNQGQPTSTFFGRLVIVGARVRLNARIGPVTTPYVSAGIAFTNATSPVYQSLDASGTDVSLGIGLRVLATRHLVGHVEITDYHYRRAVLPNTTQVNNDLLLSVGAGLMP